MECPGCGAPMEHGWLICGMPCIWTSHQSGGIALLSGGFLEGADDVRLPKDETGRPVAWSCRKCRKLIVNF